MVMLRDRAKARVYY